LDEKEMTYMKIPCQNNNQKFVRSDYIYRKIRKKSKRQVPENGFALIEKRYHTILRPQKPVIGADIVNT
jgi:hypothetical protein